MELYFTKEIVKYGFWMESIESSVACTYRLYSNENLLGLYTLGENFDYFSFYKKGFKVDKKRCEIIEEKSNSVVGKYSYKSFSFHKYRKLGEIEIEGAKFEAHIIKPKVNHDIFKKSTWGYANFLISNSDNSIYYDYRESNYLNYRYHKKIEGNISSKNDNILEIFSGIAMLEIRFYLEDIDD